MRRALIVFLVGAALSPIVLFLMVAESLEDPPPEPASSWSVPGVGREESHRVGAAPAEALELRGVLERQPRAASCSTTGEGRRPMPGPDSTWCGPGEVGYRLSATLASAARIEWVGLRPADRGARTAAVEVRVSASGVAAVHSWASKAQRREVAVVLDSAVLATADARSMGAGRVLPVATGLAAPDARMLLRRLTARSG